MKDPEKKKRYGQLRNYYERQCRKHKLDPQDYDLYGNIDWSLSKDEQTAQVDTYIQMAVPIVERATKEDKERYEAEIHNHILERVTEHNTEHFNRMNTERNDVIDKIDMPIHDAVSKLCRTGVPLLIIEGRHGNGKSYAVDTQIKRESAEDRTRIFTTTVTKAFLYRIGFENREKGRIIVMRDINPFRKELLDTLKAMTDTREPRLIYKNAYSKENDDLDAFYQFEGSIVIEVNHVPQDSDLKADIDALLSRSIFVPFHLSQDEIKAKMKSIAKEEWQREVTESLMEMESVDINLRTQFHAFKTYEWAKQTGKDWKATVKEELIRLGKPREFWRVFALIGEKWVKRSELVRTLVTTEGFGVRTAQRRIKELCDGEIMHAHGNFVGLVPLQIS